MSVDDRKYSFCEKAGRATYPRALGSDSLANCGYVVPEPWVRIRLRTDRRRFKTLTPDPAGPPSQPAAAGRFAFAYAPIVAEVEIGHRILARDTHRRAAVPTRSCQPRKALGIRTRGPRIRSSDLGLAGLVRRYQGQDTRRITSPLDFHGCCLNSYVVAQRWRTC